MSIDYEIVKLMEDHDVSDFDCGDASIDRFLEEKALVDQNQRYSSTYVMVNKANGEIMAFATVLNGIVTLTDEDREDFPGRGYTRMPALLLARLGRHIPYRGEGYGKEMTLYCIGLAMELSKIVGCRLVYVDSYVDRVGFYESLGFVRYSEDEPEEDGGRDFVRLCYDLGGED